MKKLSLFTFALLAIGAMYFAPVNVEATESVGLPYSIEACTSCHSDIKPVEKIDSYSTGDLMAIEVIAESTIEPKRGGGAYASSRSPVGAITRICKTTYYGVSKIPI